MRAGLALLILVFLTTGISASGASTSNDLSEFAFQRHPLARLPLVSQFNDEQGQAVTLGEFFTGKPVVLVLDYLRCKTLCGLTLENLVSALSALPLDAGRDFQVVVVSIDPRDAAGDVAAAKAKYLGSYGHPGKDGGWHFLTGRQPAVQLLADTVGFPYRYEAALDQYIHPAGFLVASPDGSISQYLLGAGTTAQDLRTALAEAAEGRAVSLVTRLLLLCHGDTPQLGRYSLAIEGAFVTANLAAMIGGIAVFVAIRRRRHHG